MNRSKILTVALLAPFSLSLFTACGDAPGDLYRRKSPSRSRSADGTENFDESATPTETKTAAERKKASPSQAKPAKDDLFTGNWTSVPRPQPTDSPTPSSTPTPRASDTPAPSTTSTPQARPTPTPTPLPQTPAPRPSAPPRNPPQPSPTPAASPKPVVTPAPKPTQAPQPSPTPRPSPKPSVKPQPVVTPKPIITPKPVETPTPEPAKPSANSKPQILKGWLPEYDAHIRATVAQFPDLLEVSNERMESFCPAWKDFNRKERLDFYVSLTYAIVGPESDYRRTSSTVETTMSIDAVTGYQVRSEGLLQLSYQDARNYREYDKMADQYCPFDFKQDRELFLDDLGHHGGNPDRTILNAYNNLSCGMFIYHMEVSRFRDDNSFVDAVGGYWAVMRTSHKDSYARVRRGLLSREPRCALDGEEVPKGASKDQ